MMDARQYMPVLFSQRFFSFNACDKRNRIENTVKMIIIEFENAIKIDRLFVMI